ncbi:MAG: hypothetical protein GY795_32185 [Desulfobacterales bacterium]|nr:hypothetical protein [Desulfobacterales bacterium]
MKYKCGTDVMLGDEIMVEYSPYKESLARVVAIGPDLVIDEIDQEFYSWAKSESVIDKDTVVVEWIGTNPLSHNDPNYAPVGNYMTLHSLCCERFIRRRGGLTGCNYD